MEICTVDWNELIKILTPFILAYFVYRVWHNQKGKEVIASMAKEATMDALELITLVAVLAYKTPLDSQKLEDEILKLTTLNHIIFRKLMFLEKCLNDKNFEKLVMDYTKYLGKITLLTDVIPASSSLNRPDEGILSESVSFEFGQLSEKLIDELKDYSTYRRSFRFK